MNIIQQYDFQLNFLLIIILFCQLFITYYSIDAYSKDFPRESDITFILF